MDGSVWVEPVLSQDKCVLLKDHNAVTPARLEPAALRSRVKHSTTEPLRSLLFDMSNVRNFKKKMRRKKEDVYTLLCLWSAELIKAFGLMNLSIPKYL